MELNLDSGLWGSPGLRDGAHLDSGVGAHLDLGWDSPGLRDRTHLDSEMGLTWTQGWGFTYLGLNLT